MSGTVVIMRIRSKLTKPYEVNTIIVTILYKRKQIQRS